MSNDISNQYHVEASITWIRADIIAKKIISHTEVYYLNIKFLQNPYLWSVNINIDSILTQYKYNENTYITQIGFLVEEKVFQFLEVGMDFWLLEGPYSLVGNGTILRIDKNINNK